MMSSSPEFISIPPGDSGNVTIYVTSVNGFSAPVNLTTGSPPGIICNLTTSSLTPNPGDTASAILTITVEEWASPDMYHINVEGTCTDPAIMKMTDINLDIQPPAEWGPGISLSQSYAQAGDSITVTGANFPPACQGETVTIKEVFSDTVLDTTPATIIVDNGGFTGTFTIPSGIPYGNYRIEARVLSTGDFAERDFQILGTGETFTLGVSPQSVTVTTELGSHYNTKVVSNLKDMVALAAVSDEAGSQIRWPRGTRLKVNFWRDSDAGYAFESKVLGYDRVKGTVCVLLHHAKTLKREQQRRYRRSAIHRPCFFFPVLVVSSGPGRRSAKKAVVQTTRRYLGNLIDISAGGCSIISVYPLKPGDLCKIEFELARRQRITVFGKVKRIRKSGFRSRVMHIMFTKLSSHFLNQIYLYVYDYTPPRVPIAAR